MASLPSSVSFSLEAPSAEDSALTSDLSKMDLGNCIIATDDNINITEEEDRNTSLSMSKKNDVEVEEDEEEEEEEEEEFLDARDDLSPNLEKESITDKEWRCQEKHFFVLSEAGKPIYSRHGDENELASLTAVMQALVSFVQDLDDSIKCISFDDAQISFLIKPPLILLGTTRRAESHSQMITQLTYIYNQILSVLTLKQLNKIFEKKKSYDLRIMLGGAERLLTHLISAFQTDPSFMLNSVRVLHLPSSVRDSISNAIHMTLSKTKNVVFVVLMAENHLVTLIRMKQYYIHSADLHILFNFVNSSESLKNSESWTPICLPKFNSNGFLHAHVSYLKEDVPVCLLMLTVQKDIFFELSEAKKKIVGILEKNNAIPAMMESLKTCHFDAKSIGVPEIRHFLYKSKVSGQFTSTTYSPPYNLEEDKRRLNIMCWATPTFDIYATFDPLTSRIVSINAVNKLLRWIKKEEGSLFINSAPTF
ncbi:MON1 [Lepeophtheirus salmonis]|uniref:Vacuolar fusion protein MON1 homolog n=1 Tax=Lepeophtheirus salmonis TaxID=72036 RepID=A0A7R8H854_LEPSM|nr:MON1 [Lepeophtheirus salmonis]CAF2923916.1 MON1 [Lepeophtheirus salmonis]